MNENTNNEPTVRDVLRDLRAHEKVCDARHAAIERHFAALESRLDGHAKLLYALLAMQTALVVGMIGGGVALVVG